MTPLLKCVSWRLRHSNAHGVNWRLLHSNTHSVNWRLRHSNAHGVNWRLWLSNAHSANRRLLHPNAQCELGALALQCTVWTGGSCASIRSVNWRLLHSNGTVWTGGSCTSWLTLVSFILSAVHRHQMPQPQSFAQASPKNEGCSEKRLAPPSFQPRAWPLWWTSPTQLFTKSSKEIVY